MAWILPFPRKEAPGFSGFLGSMLDFLPRAHFQFAVHPPPSSGPPSREVLGQKVRICGQSLCFGRLLFIFGLRVEFCVMFFFGPSLFIPFWPFFIAEVFSRKGRICGQQGTFAWSLFIFGLRVEFLCTLFIPFWPFYPILRPDFDSSRHFHVMYCSSSSFWVAFCSFGLRVEFCDTLFFGPYFIPFFILALVEVPDRAGEGILGTPGTSSCSSPPPGVPISKGQRCTSS